MKKIWKVRERGLLLLAVLCVSAAMGWHFIVLPLQAEMVRLDEEMLTQEKILKRCQLILKHVNEYERQYEDLSSKYNLAASETEINRRLVADIQGIAEPLPFRITNLRPQKISKEDRLQRYSIDIVLDADVVDVWKFIYTLQKSPYDFSVTDARFDKVHHNKKEELKVRLTLSKTFFMQSKDEKPKR